MPQPVPYFGNRMDDHEILVDDETAPLNVEFSTFIESHFKCTIMSFNLMFRVCFSVNFQSLPGPPWGQPALRIFASADENTPPNLSFCRCIEVNYWKGI